MNTIRKSENLVEVWAKRKHQQEKENCWCIFWGKGFLENVNTRGWLSSTLWDFVGDYKFVEFRVFLL